MTLDELVFELDDILLGNAHLKNAKVILVADANYGTIGKIEIGKNKIELISEYYCED